MKSSSDEQAGALAKQLRQERGWTQQELATMMRGRGCKWNQATVWSTEKGDRPLRYTEAVALFVELFGVKIEDIFNGVLAEPERSNYLITVAAFDMTEWQSDALFTRVADAAHARDEQVTCSSGPLTDEDEF